MTVTTATAGSTRQRRCRPAPLTRARYARMFSRLKPGVYAAKEVAAKVRMPYPSLIWMLSAKPNRCAFSPPVGKGYRRMVTILPA